MAAVWSDYTIQSRSELLVLLAIADNANREDGIAWPSIDFLAKKARCSQRGVQAAISSLICQNKLEVNFGTGPNGTNVYKVIVGGGAKSAPRNQPYEKRQKSVRLVAPKPSGTVRNHQEPESKEGVLTMVREKLNQRFKRQPNDPWGYIEEYALVDLGKRPNLESELYELLDYCQKLPLEDQKYLPNSVSRFLERWCDLLDKSRTYKPQIQPHERPGVRLKCLESEIEKHPANRDSVHYRQDCTDAQRQDLKTLRQKRNELNGQIARA